MLTEIEWWGGLLFIWIAICYRLSYREYRAVGGSSLSFVVFNLAFLCSGVVLALYFYPLESGPWNLLYLAALALGIVTCALMMFWPAADTGEDEETDDDADDEEVGAVLGALAGAILFFPLLASLVLGLMKSIDLVGTL